MTQFMLCVPRSVPVADDVRLRSIESDPWLIPASKALLDRPELAEVPYLTDGASIDDLFKAAHEVVLNGGDFSVTHLSSVLRQMTGRCSALVIWWAGDWADLPVVNSTEDLLRAVDEQLRTPVGDVYIRWESL
ncbi:MAG TPA: hypothetical protein VGR02_08810 [Thermoanaerobaculia bacterium]|jgi:hypothetical protein|nr:hypothetical protein [Thermoanaerobaculia bacterium]